MKKWKDTPNNEKWMLILIVLLLLGILIRWGAVREGVSKGFNWFQRDTPEAPAQVDSTAVEMLDSIPVNQLDVLRMEQPE